MKKLISSLSSLSLLINSFSAVACGSNQHGNEKNEISEQLQGIIDSTSLITKMLLLGKHENLNYVPNPLIREIYAPDAYWTSIPTSFAYDNKKTDFSATVNDFNTNYNKMVLHTKNAPNDGDLDNAILNQYFVGMFDNQYYTTGFNDNGFVFNNLQKQIATDSNRKNLVGFGEDLGALSSYIINNQVNFDDPADRVARMIVTPGDYNWGVRSSPNLPERAFAADTDSDVEQKKSLVTTLLNSQKTINFGKYDATIDSTAAKTAAAGKISQYISLLWQIAPNESGAQIGTTLITNLIGLLKGGIKYETNPLSGLFQILLSYYVGVIQSFAGITPFVSLGAASIEPNEDIKKIVENNPELSSLLKNESFKNSQLFTTGIAQLATGANFSFDEALDMTGSYQDFIAIVDQFDKSLTPLSNKASLETLVSKKIVESLTGQLKALSFYGDIVDQLYAFALELNNVDINLINIIRDFADLIKCIINYKPYMSKIDQYSKVDVNQLSKNELESLEKDLGWDPEQSTEFLPDSILNHIYQALNNQNAIAYNEFNFLFNNVKSPFYTTVSSTMSAFYDEFFKYILDGKYWTVDNVIYQNAGATEESITYSLNYSGIGDSSVTWLNTKDTSANIKTDTYFDDAYNVTQVYDPQYSEQDLINYSGTGMEFKPVNHQYDITWTNIGTVVKPMWIITKVNSFVHESEITNGVGSSLTGPWKQIYFLY